MFFNVFVLLCTLASQVFAFNITINTLNLTTSQILDIPDSFIIKTACSAICTLATSTIQVCDDDPTCLCNANTVSALLGCEQCMFDNLIALNQRTDFRVGSQAILNGYATSCKAVANVTLRASQTALQLPLSWDGPFDVILPVGGVVVVVVTGAFLGFFALLVLSNM